MYVLSGINRLNGIRSVADVLTVISEALDPTVCHSAMELSGEGNFTSTGYVTDRQTGAALRLHVLVVVVSHR